MSPVRLCSRTRPFHFRRLGVPACLLLCVLVTQAQTPADPFRLGPEVVPVAQSVALTLDPAKDDFAGRTVIDLRADAPFTRFRLHALGLALTAPTLTSEEGEVVPLVVESADVAHGLVTFAAPRPLGAGSYKLVIEFAGRFPRDGFGLYKTESRGDAYLFTQFADKHARKCFPCWDEPAFKIPWQITLDVPAAAEAVTNTAVAAETRDGDRKTIAFGRTPPMPSYLVAIAIGPFEFFPVAGSTVPARIITPKGQSALAAEAARLTPPILSRLEAYFGIPYPYAKFDQIAVPEFVYGAMENAGLVSFTDRVLLVQPDKASFAQRQLLAHIIAHEAAHMWFGNLVTMRWWDDLWLNESFADWMAGRIVEREFPGFRIRLAESREVETALRTDALPSVTAIRRPVTPETDLGQLVDELTYFKGKAVLNMVESWIGPEKFRAAMRAYVQKHRWGSTTGEDLWAALGDASGEDVAGMLSGFIDQPGVPLVSFALTPDGKLRLAQRRFHALGEAQPAGIWRIPVVLSWSRAGVVRRERLLLREAEQIFDLPGLATADWIYPNVADAGYYRWALSPELEARLARAGAALAPIERLGRLDNGTALFGAGLIGGADYLAALTALGRDPDADVNLGVIESISALDAAFAIAATRPAYHAYLAAVLRPMLERIGLRPLDGESDAHGPLRTALYGALGLGVADPDVVAECRRLSALFLANPTAVDAALLGPALAVAAHHGDAALFTSLRATAGGSSTPLGRAAALGALGSFGDAALAERALALSLTPEINSTEFLGVVHGVAKNPDLRPLALGWIMANYEAIAAKAPPTLLAGLVEIAAAEPEEFARLRDFLLAPGRTSEFAESNARKAADRLALRTRLRGKHQAEVARFLATYAAPQP